MGKSAPVTSHTTADSIRTPEGNSDDVGSDGTETMDEANMVEILEDIRSQGDKFFEKKNWSCAMTKYSKCIDEAARMNPSSETRSEKFSNVVKLAYSSRAESQLRLRNFDVALADAEKALELDPAHLKSLCRQGQAAIEIGLYEKACKAFEAVLKLRPDQEWILENLQKSRIWLKQSRTGNHVVRLTSVFADFQEDEEQSSRSQNFQKYADYVGPVEIRAVDYAHGGRGLFAKESVKAYTLLVVSTATGLGAKKPFDRRKSHASATSVNPSGCSNGCSKHSTSPAHDRDVVKQVVQRVTASKRTLAQLYSLASSGTEDMEVPPMELFKPGSEWVPPGTSALKVDANLITDIVGLNAFRWNIYSGISSGTLTDGLISPVTSGFWVFPSFLNHSCVPNCSHMVVGNVKFVRALRDIKAGEELTINYFTNLFVDIEGRQERARKFSFTCRCERCTLEKQLNAEFSMISSMVKILIPCSKTEFADPKGQLQVLQELAHEAFTVLEIFYFMSPKEDDDLPVRRIEMQLDRLVATKQLANVADRVEALIELQGEKLATHQRRWIRGSFLGAYLAKYVLAKTCEPTSAVRFLALHLIVESMKSICVSDHSLLFAHMLVQEVMLHYGQESNTYKITKRIGMEALKGCFDDEESVCAWNVVLLTDPPFDYGTFFFDGTS